MEVRSEVTDITRTHPFVDTFFIESVQAPKNPPGSPPKPKSGLNLPTPKIVYEADWHKYDFKEKSALKIYPGENKESYVYVVNADNVYLKHIQRERFELKDIFEKQYCSAMVFIGLSLLHKSTDEPGRDVLQEIEETAEKISLVLIPMINGLGGLANDSGGD